MSKAIRKQSVLSALPLVMALVAMVYALYAVQLVDLASGAEPFGVESFSVEPTKGTRVTELGPENFEFVNEPYNTPYTQAGGHPWGFTVRGQFKFEEVTRRDTGETVVVPTQDPRDVVIDLPPGLLGDPMAVPRCPLTLVTSSSEQCPADTQIGSYSITLQGGHELLAPVVDVMPEAGQSAEFALENTTKIQTPLMTGRLVRTAQGYGFRVVSAAIPLIGIQSFEVTIWGVPADASHDPMRGRICRRPAPGRALSCGRTGGEHFGSSPIVPFVTMGTNCTAGPETMTIRADSWQEPGSIGTNGQYTEQWKEASAPWPYADSGVTGCDLLPFAPTIEARPSTTLADEATGLDVDLKVPLSETPVSLATPQVRDSTLTLPAGLSVNPSVVDGIEACDETGPRGIDIEGPESEEVGLNGELQLAPGHCPNASIVGTAEAITPFLPEPVKGHLFLARPRCGGAGQNPCGEQDVLDGNLYRLYLELGGTGELADTGVHFKVPMQTQVNPATGQLTTRVLDTPQAPFSELKVKLEGGPRAPLASPSSCGVATSTSDFRPWSAPGILNGVFVAGTPDATPSSFFEVHGCSSPQPFAPGFSAGTVIPNAGRFSAFTMNLSREDREQYVRGIQLHTPPGLSGVIAGIPLCGEAQADAGTCPAESKLGTTRVATGAGSHPFEIGGDVFLTGPYEGAPFGLSIVVRLDVGPFHLGVQVVRARIAVGKSDGTLTVTTDETGPYAVPQIVFGVPVRLRRVTVDIDRPDFMFNPTNCSSRQQIVADISGSQGAVTQVSSPFTAGSCKDLAFKPRFRVATSGRTSRAKGASLDVRLSYPSNSLGVDANVERAKVSLPKALPSRLSTLQHACPAALFAANPGGCPSASIVGIVKATTPLLPVQLAGPAYFVSHGGEEFPNLIMVLQGDNVRVDLVANTFISKGITSSTLKTVPDLPVGSFELYLPEGPYSALAANRNLCKVTGGLKMPTEFVAQNGAVFRQQTKIQVTGCKRISARASRRHRSRTVAASKGGR